MSQQRRTTNAAAKKVIFNARAVATRLEGLRAAAGEEGGAWWRGALSFDWTSLRKGNNGTQWVSVSYTDEVGITARLVLRISGERHTGQIMPNTDEGVAELTQRLKNPSITIKKRDQKPAISIQKWAARVETADDGLTVKTDEEGNPVLPGDDKLSPYYRVAALLDEAFSSEAGQRIDRGTALLAKVAAMKKLDKGVTAQAVLDAFAAEEGARRPGDTILSSETVAALRKFYPSKVDLDLLTRGAITTSNTKIAHLVQEFISDRALKNAGSKLPNPMTRIAMNFDTTTGIADQLALFDKDQPYQEEGRQKYDIGKVDGEPVNADTIHRFIVPRATLDGIVNADSVCFSNMGISMPVKAQVLVVSQPAARSVGIDDVYDDEDEDGGSSGFTLADVASPSPAPAPRSLVTPVPGAAAADAPAGAPAAAEDYSSLLNELSGASPVAGRTAP